MICETSHGHDEEHGDEEHHDDKDHNGRMLDGHEAAAGMPTNSTMPMDHGEEGHGEDDYAMQCMKAWRLLRSMEEYSMEDTTDERRQEISDMWSEGLEGAWSEVFEGATATFAASVAGLATAVAVLSF